MTFRRTRIAIAVAALSAFVVLGGGHALAQTDAATAMKKINEDLRAKSQTMSPYEYVDYAEKAMLDFLKKYPKSAGGRAGPATGSGGSTRRSASTTRRCATSATSSPRPATRGAPR